MSIFSFGQSLNPDSQCVKQFHKRQEGSELSKLEIKNRQGFNILLNPLRGKSPEFLVTSPYGEVYTVTLLLIEKLDPKWMKEISEARSEKEQMEVIHRYLLDWFDHPNPFHIHFEKYQGQYFIRFGSYGLKGGGKEEKEKGLALSSAQVVIGIAGVYFGVPLANVMALSGISSLAQGLYIKDEDFNEEQYYNRLRDSYVFGAVACGVGSLPIRSDIARPFWPAISSAIAGIATLFTREGREHKRLPNGTQSLLKEGPAGLLE